MKCRIASPTLAIMVLILGISNVMAEGLTVQSAWKNQSGSTFTIDTMDASGRISGTYVNRAINTGCRNSPFPFTGYVNGKIISWSVSWKNGHANCNSATGWTGYVENGAITTFWNLSYFSTSGGEIAMGKDVFKRITVENSDSLVTK